MQDHRILYKGGTAIGIVFSATLFLVRLSFLFVFRDRPNVRTTQVASKTSAPLSTFQQLANGQEFLLGNQKQHFSVKYGVVFVNFSTKSYMSLKAHQIFLYLLGFCFQFCIFQQQKSRVEKDLV